MLIAIDGGSTKSGYVVMNSMYVIHKKGKDFNEKVIDVIMNNDWPNVKVVIEKPQPFKMVPNVLLDTCTWNGRFIQAAASRGISAYFIPRQKVRKYFVPVGRSNDALVREAIIKRFGYPCTRKEQDGNFFYNDKDVRMVADVWQAYALGVLFTDWDNGTALIDPAIMNSIENVV